MTSDEGKLKKIAEWIAYAFTTFLLVNVAIELSIIIPALGFPPPCVLDFFASSVLTTPVMGIGFLIDLSEIALLCFGGAPVMGIWLLIDLAAFLLVFIVLPVLCVALERRQSVVAKRWLTFVSVFHQVLYLWSAYYILQL